MLFNPSPQKGNGYGYSNCGGQFGFIQNLYAKARLFITLKDDN